jgi:sigma-B regulation protein RsbU (phosphoserine phosphatase)
MPLGMVAGAEFSVMGFRVNEGDRLMLLSDGVVEAQNEKRELFGFERTRALANQPAAAVADAAQCFGHEDDITVVSVVRGISSAAAVA